MADLPVCPAVTGLQIKISDPAPGNDFQTGIMGPLDKSMMGTVRNKDESFGVQEFDGLVDSLQFDVRFTGYRI